jgi:Uma2 family endonuclease
MASILDNRAVRDAAVPISVEQYHRLGQTGILSQPTELLRGVIVEKMVKSPEHSWIVQWFVDWLRENVPTGFHVRQEQPLTFADSEPEPDITVVVGDPSDYRHSHPHTAALVIEVAIWSEALDREKAVACAAAGVTEFWLVLPDDKTVEAFSQPAATGYAARRTAAGGEELDSIAVPGLRLSLAELFAGGG